ncbi:hypothetical protein SCLCIDRAFT_25984 [Scleroderma citrinum Foug A]|uniref:Uncharacterized protein n=1 Tax=Scleroderma citrinum Foug A TaxID=1036808 RepID=A0A0C3A8Z2_9AGAM|nr:hypothetical protein SCLCIDRAFT_25984 [Scleroderma citrinum Foug A]
MVFFKSLFRNPPDIEDESYALDFLEKGAPTTDNFSTCATPVLGADAAPMDTDDTVLTLTVPPADNMPGSFRILPSSGSSEQTSGGQGTMVVYNRSLMRSAPENTALHPPKVLLREVDYSSTLHAQPTSVLLIECIDTGR